MTYSSNGESNISRCSQNYFIRLFSGKASKFVNNIYALTNFTPRNTTPSAPYLPFNKICRSEKIIIYARKLFIYWQFPFTLCIFPKEKQSNGLYNMVHHKPNLEAKIEKKIFPILASREKKPCEIGSIMLLRLVLPMATVR